jgi:hypothetical protein
VHVVADVSVDDGPSEFIFPCLVSPLPPEHTTHGLRLAQVNDVPCGSTVWLRNVVIPWNANPEGGGETCEFRPQSCNAWQPAKCAGEPDQGIVAEPEPGPTPTETVIPTPTEVAPPVEPTPTDVAPPAEPTPTDVPPPVEPTPTEPAGPTPTTAPPPPVEPAPPTPVLIAQPENPALPRETPAVAMAQASVVELADEVEVLPEAGTAGALGGNPMLTLSVITVGAGAALVWLRRRLS